MDFSWAIQYPEVHKVCKLFQMQDLSEPIRYSYTPLEQYLQEGPQCGLVALAICLGKSNKETVELLYNYAKKRNFTINGEIFSAQDMEELARNFLMDSNVEVYIGDMNNEKIREFLLAGGLILVPYDTNKDNSPGFHKGHKAHWAVICGAVLTKLDFFVLVRHGKARNVAIWKLSILAQSNVQLFEFSPDRKFSNVAYKLPKGGIGGSLGLNEKCILIKQ